MIFLKPPSAALVAPPDAPLRVPLPQGRGSVHYETEIVFRVGPDGATCDAVTLGLDLTLRDVQAAAKAAGHPWDAAKVFPGAAVLGAWVPLASFDDWADTPFTFALNGDVKQTGRGRDMITPPPAALAAAAATVGVVPGDLLFTGTPAGVGPVVVGDAARVAWGGRVAYDVVFE
jgi:2-keto-4-pentenoate hydratase/2-oxohepta-3-ene-1,7-dioic acid hydratase in catechol pathway